MDLSSSYASLLREPVGLSETPVCFDVSGDYVVLHLTSLTHRDLWLVGFLITRLFLPFVRLAV